MTELLSLAMAAALLSDGTPLKKRMEILRPMFDPAPGALVNLDVKELRDFGSQSRTKANPRNLRGHIKVIPPKGHCLLLRRSLDEEDISICKPKNLVFTLADMDRAGKLNWTVITGPGDFGTEIFWQMPYRLAIVEKADSPVEEPPQYFFIEKCQADKNTVLGRRVKISLFGGEEWSLRLPAEDEILPQPDSVPNLYIAKGRPRGGISADDGGKSSEHGEKPAAEEHGKKEDKAEGHGGEKKAVESVSEKALAMQKEDEQLEDRKSWSLPMRGSYKVDGSMFSNGVSVMRGAQGICRYRFDGPDDDPAVGRMECHDVGGYRMVFAPLTCIGELLSGAK